MDTYADDLAALVKELDLTDAILVGHFLHGGDDQLVPIADSAQLSAKIVKNAALNIYKGAPHGMGTTHKDQVNKDLLEFIKS